MKDETRTLLASGPRRAVCIVLWLAFAATAWAESVTVTDSGNPISRGYSIGAVGLGLSGRADRFGTTRNLGGQVAVGGGSFSLAPTGGIPADPVPEPVAMAMIGAGLIGLGFLRRRAVR